MTGRDLVLACRGLVGTPWEDRGRSSQGVDCGGLLLVAGKSLGLVGDDFERVYPTERSYDGLHETLAALAVEVPAGSEPMEGDIVTYSFMGDMVAHCAVQSVQDGTIIHAYPAVKKVAEHTMSGKWERRVHRRYRAKGLG